jgi:predicted CopG family antitoxin
LSTTTLTITEEAYKLLKEHSREGESFTDSTI